MSQKTTSSTLCVGDWTYIFLNKPETKFIDFIRFKIPTQPQTGLVGIGGSPIVASPGPLASIVYGTENQPEKQIRLYYINESKVIKEIKLENAQDDTTDLVKGWIATPAKGPTDLQFERAFPSGTRTVDASSFLSASSRVVSGTRVPVLSYKAATAADEAGYIAYTSYSGQQWAFSKLEIPED